MASYQRKRNGTTATTKGVTFASLKRMEPRLADLEADVNRFVTSLKRKRLYCANGAWHGYGRRPRYFRFFLQKLVGWGRTGGHTAAEEVLTSSDAYDVATAHLYGLLPDCRECGCIPALSSDTD